MNAIQLEFNIESVPEDEHRMSQMQKQIDDAVESMGKVRRRMFHELGAMKQAIAALQAENIELKQMVRKLTNQKIEWIYGEKEQLFTERAK